MFLIINNDVPESGSVGARLRLFIATAKIEELMNELKKEFTIIIVTHSMQQAARVSTKTGFFHLGKLIEVDSTETIFSNPGNQKTQDYITGRFG